LLVVQRTVPAGDKRQEDAGNELAPATSGQEEPHEKEKHMLSILNNVAATAAQNQMEITNTDMQSTLEQLSSGQRINSGADDAAGLSIADGLNANVAALTQSSQNATSGVGELQVADGALAQVTSLLNRAVTLATEAANSGLTTDQHTALNTEFTSIKTEIDNIGQTTTYNGSAIFGSGAGGGAQTQSTDPNTLVSSAIDTTAAAANADTASGALVVDAGGKTLTFTPTASETVGNFVNDINASGKGVQASVNSTGNLVLTDTLGRGDIKLDTTNSFQATVDGGAAATPTFANQGLNNLNVLTGSAGVVAGASGGGAGTLTVTTGGVAHNFTVAAGDKISDVINTINNAGTGITASLDSATGKVSLTDTQDNGDIAVSGTAANVAALDGSGSFSNPALMTSSNTLSVFLSDSTQTGTSTVNVALNTFNSSNLGVAGQGIANNDLTTTTDAATALTAINTAISNVSALRGTIGAGVNQLQAATNVISSQTQNLQTASSNITSADIGQVVSNMTEYSILSQTGMAAMAQANSMQKNILTLLQG
jgi:flagellin